MLARFKVGQKFSPVPVPTAIFASYEMVLYGYIMPDGNAIKYIEENFNHCLCQMAVNLKADENV